MNCIEIAKVIDNGGLVIIPTDTIYGICGDALNGKAIEKVYIVKEREKNKHLVLLVDSIEMARKYVKNINPLQNELIKKYSKYSLTIDLPKNDKLPKELNSTIETVGVRIPNNDNLKEIIRLLDRPIFSTSANKSGEPVITDISLLDEDMRKNIDYIYDGGTINNYPSTIVKVDGDKIIIIRDGKAGEMIKKDFKLKNI